jgi:hypothetical protein
MKPAGLPLVAWGTFILLLGVGLLAWSGAIAGPWLLLAASGTACIASGFVVGLLLPEGDRRRALPDISLSPTVMAGGLLVLLVAVAAGRWLVLPGLGVIALGAGGLVRELRAQRRELR